MSEKISPTEESSIIKAENSSKEISEVPPSLQYISALSPKHLTPFTFKGETRGARIAIIDPREKQSVLNVYRFIAHYEGGITSVQDEIMFPGENEGAQLNFEFSESEKPIKYSETNLSELSQRAVTMIKELSTVKGSIIDAREGVRFVSDGSSWVQEFKDGSTSPIPSLNFEEAPRLES